MINALPEFYGGLVVSVRYSELAVLKGNFAMNNEGTIYVAHWTHTPENCPGRTNEGAKMISDFWADREAAEKKWGIKILGSYVTVTEHDYYIIVQARDYKSVVEFFLPLVPTQTGSFRPVLPMDEWIKMNKPE